MSLQLYLSVKQSSWGAFGIYMELSHEESSFFVLLLKLKRQCIPQDDIIYKKWYYENDTYVN